MKKKAIVSFIIGFIIFMYSFSCFASNEIVGGITGNVLNNTENVVSDMTNGIGSATESVVNGVTNVAEDIGNGVSDMADSLGNGIQEGTQDVTNYIIPDNSLRSDTTTEYNATAINTASENTFLGLNTTAWWWVIIGAICVLIIVLVWNRMNKEMDSNSND